MTPTLLFWFRIGAWLLIGYTLYTMIRPMVQRNYIVPKNRKEWRSLLSDLFSLAAGLFLIFILQKNYSAPMEAVMEFKGKPLPSFSYLNTRSGTEETLDQYNDKVVILNIWATWCPPCRREMPELDKLQKEHPSALAVVAISDESPEIISHFNTQHSYSYPTGAFLSTNALIQSINTRPVSILIINGKVEDIVIGGRGYSFFSDWIGPYIKKIN